MAKPFVLPVVLILVSCQQSPVPASLSAEEEARIATEVVAAVEDYFDAFRSLDADRMIKFWADVEGFAMASDGSILTGYDVWTDGMQERLASMAEVHFATLSNQRVCVLGPDAASYMMEFEWSRTTKEGETINASGSWLYVLKRFPEGWRAIHSGGTHIFS